MDNIGLCPFCSKGIANNYADDLDRKLAKAYPNKAKRTIRANLVWYAVDPAQGAGFVKYCGPSDECSKRNLQKIFFCQNDAHQPVLGVQAHPENFPDRVCDWCAHALKKHEFNDQDHVRRTYARYGRN